MNISSLTSFFKKKSSQLASLDTILIKRLKSLSRETNLLVFKDVNIYHHASRYNIRLIVLDSLRGLYLFESKEWTYDELKNANVQKAQNQKNSHDTLSYQNTQDIIKQKFNEVIHNDGVSIFNYLLMENLNADEYEHLNDSFHSLLPQEKIIFSDSNQADILKKLQNSCEEDPELQSLDKIIGALFFQYTILDEHDQVFHGTTEQQNFIDTPLKSLTYLSGVHKSGKSNLLLLKSILELLDKTSDNIIILKPTVLACDLFKKKLLAIIEHAIIEIDLSSIEIITPLELVNRHLIKLGMTTLTHPEINPKLMQKNHHFADTIFCDDSDYLDAEFINYLQHIQKKSKLILVTTMNISPILSKSFRADREITFHMCNPHAKVLHLIANLLAKKSKKILVVSNPISKNKLLEDLESFIEESPKVIDSSTALINQKFDNLLFCSYLDLNELRANHIIMMDLCFLSKNEVEYAFNLASMSVNIIYEEECEEIKKLRKRYEQSYKEQ